MLWNRFSFERWGNMSGLRDAKKVWGRKLTRAVPVCSVFALVSCTRACVGIPEVGSKRTPVRLFLASASPVDKEKLNSISQCVELAAHYRVQFEVAADERAVLSALGRGEAHLAYLSPMNYVAASTKFGAVAHRVRLESGSPVNRSVIIGKASVWAAHLEKQHVPLTAAGLRSESALSLMSEGRFLFAAPESDVGFFVPRQILLQRNVFPEEAAFAGNDELVAQGLERNLAIAGAVSESWLRQKYEVSQFLRPGMVVGPFWIVEVSPSFPGRVLASRPDFSQKILTQILAGMDQCSGGSAATEIASVFGGESFGTVSERMFVYVRELKETQDTFLRAVDPEKKE